jgi:hypothetical protein
MDGFHLNQLNCIHAQAFHVNLILLPLDTALAMTDHYPTDKDARAGRAFGPTREVQRDSNQPKVQHDPKHPIVSIQIDGYLPRLFFHESQRLQSLHSVRILMILQHFFVQSFRIGTIGYFGQSRCMVISFGFAPVLHRSLPVWLASITWLASGTAH